MVQGRRTSAVLLRAVMAVMGLALSVLAFPRVARAAPSHTSALGWTRLPGADSCIGARDLALAVEDRLGRVVFVSPAHADVIIDGRIEPATAPATFRAHITVSSQNGEALGMRDLEGTGTCRALDAQIALVVALLIDPDAALGANGAPVLPVPLCIEPVRAAPPPPPAAPPAPPPKEPWRGAIAVGPAMTLGLLPGVAFGIALRGEVTPPGLFPFELGGVFFPEVHALPAGASSASTQGALVGLSFATVGVCPLAWRSDGTRLAACAELSVGAVRAVGYGFASGSGAGEAQPIVDASVTGRVARSIVGPLEVGVNLGLVVPLRPARVYFEDATGSQQELFRMSAVAGLFDVTLGLSFP